MAVIDYKEEEIIQLDEDGKQYEEQDKVYELEFTMNVAVDGALVDDQLVYDYRNIDRYLGGTDRNNDYRDFSQDSIENRKVYLVEVDEVKQRNIARATKIRVNNGEGYNYPHGHVLGYRLDNDGIRVKVKVIDIFGNQGRNVRLMLKHGFVGAMPIIEQGTIQGIGVILDAPVSAHKWNKA